MEITAEDWPGFRASFTKAAWNKNGWTKEDWRKAAHERAGAMLAGAHQARLRKMMHSHIAEATAAAAHGATQEEPWTRADGPRGDRWPGPGHHGRVADRGVSAARRFPVRGSRVAGDQGPGAATSASQC